MNFYDSTSFSQRLARSLKQLCRGGRSGEAGGGGGRVGWRAGGGGGGLLSRDQCSYNCMHSHVYFRVQRTENTVEVGPVVQSHWSLIYQTQSRL